MKITSLGRKFPTQFTYFKNNYIIKELLTYNFRQYRQIKKEDKTQKKKEKNENKTNQWMEQKITNYYIFPTLCRSAGSRVIFAEWKNKMPQNQNI